LRLVVTDRKKRQTAQSIKRVLNVGCLIPQSATEAAGGLLQGADERHDRRAVESVQRVQLLQGPVKVDSKSARGARLLAARPPSEVTMLTRKSMAPGTSEAWKAAPRTTWRVPTAAAVGLVPLRRIAAISTKPPSSRRRPAMKRAASSTWGNDRPSSS